MTLTSSRNSSASSMDHMRFFESTRCVICTLSTSSSWFCSTGCPTSSISVRLHACAFGQIGRKKLSLSSPSTRTCGHAITHLHTKNTASHQPVQHSSGFVDSMFCTSLAFAFGLRALSGSVFTVLKTSFTFAFRIIFRSRLQPPCLYNSRNYQCWCVQCSSSRIHFNVEPLGFRFRNAMFAVQHGGATIISFTTQSGLAWTFLSHTHRV